MISYYQVSASSKIVGGNVSKITENLHQLGPLKRLLAHEHTWWVTFSCFFLLWALFELMFSILMAFDNNKWKIKGLCGEFVGVWQSKSSNFFRILFGALLLNLTTSLLCFFWRKSILNNKAMQAKILFISFWVALGVYCLFSLSCFVVYCYALFFDLDDLTEGFSVYSLNSPNVTQSK